MTVFGNGAIWIDQNQADGALSALAGNADVLLFAFFEQHCVRMSYTVRQSIQYIPITYYSDGRSGNDIQYLSREEIIADVLREYERYLSIIADDDKSMIFVDKKKL